MYELYICGSPRCGNRDSTHNTTSSLCVTMADMNAIMALQKAERLVSTIARAFYTDNTVLVVDTLIREK